MSTATVPGKPAAGKLGHLFKDKRVQIGAAAAAALGLIVLLKRGTGTPGAGQSDPTGQGGSSINTGTLDSTGTDSYSAIAQLGQAWDDTWNTQFQGFQSTLTGIQGQLDQLGQAPPTTPIGGGPAVTPAPGKAGHGTGPLWGWIKVKKGDSFASIEKATGVSDSLLKGLNPGTGHLDAGDWLKFRSAAGPRPS